MANAAPTGVISVVRKAIGAKLQNADTVRITGEIQNLKNVIAHELFGSALTKEESTNLQGMLPTPEDLVDPERAKLFAAEVKAWREGGQYALVLAQRGIGSPPVAQPTGWHQRAAAELERLGRRVVIRGHPGRHQETQSLYAQLDGAAFAVTWGSGAGVKALLYGVPVYHGMARWIGAPAARPFGKTLTEPFRGDRSEMLTRLAWAQWSVEEIGSGYAFRHLLRRPQEAIQPGSLQRTG
jgi:hypothetical protein